MPANRLWQRTLDDVETAASQPASQPATRDDDVDIKSARGGREEKMTLLEIGDGDDEEVRGERERETNGIN